MRSLVLCALKMAQVVRRHSPKWVARGEEVVERGDARDWTPETWRPGDNNSIITAKGEKKRRRLMRGSTRRVARIDVTDQVVPSSSQGVNVT